MKHHTRPLASDHNSHVHLPSSFLLWDLPEHDPDLGSPAELRRHGAGIAVPHCHGAYPYLRGLAGRGFWSPGAGFLNVWCWGLCCFMPGRMHTWARKSCCSTLCCKKTFLKKRDLAELFGLRIASFCAWSLLPRSCVCSSQGEGVYLPSNYRDDNSQGIFFLLIKSTHGLCGETLAV